MSRNSVVLERRSSTEERLERMQALNAKHSNSAGLPDLGEDSQNDLQKISAKEKDHYNFLDSLRKKLHVDSSKLIDLEARISGKYLVKHNYNYRHRESNYKLTFGIE
jgi:hypothetical protein